MRFATTVHVDETASPELVELVGQNVSKTLSNMRIRDLDVALDEHRRLTVAFRLEVDLEIESILLGLVHEEIRAIAAATLDREDVVVEPMMPWAPA